MKSFILLSVLLVCSAPVFAQRAELFFEDNTIHKFPDTKEGEVLVHEFKFTNKGMIPLVILDCKVTCSCTVVEFPTEPIPPGGRGVVKVTFDTKGKISYQDRTVDVFSNSKKSPSRLRFKVKVIND